MIRLKSLYRYAVGAAVGVSLLFAANLRVNAAGEEDFTEASTYEDASTEAEADEYTEYEETESTEADSLSDTEAFNLDELVRTGTFDSEALTTDQLEYIYDLYDGDPMAVSELQKQSDYNSPDNVSLAGIGAGYSHAAKFANATVINGIDVSQWQGTIDWDAVKAAGIDFVFIRAAYRTYGSGVINTDTKFAENIAGAKAAGLDVGVYIFSQAISVTEAKEEAAYAVKLASGYGINLPVVMDFEYAGTGVGRLYNANLTVSQATTICNYFCATVESYGYTAMVYANRSLLTNDVNAAQIAANYPIWLANYTSATTYSGDYSYWQYSSTGTVSGISGNVDMNFRYITKPAQVTGLSGKATSSVNGITLNWTKVPGAYSYQVFRYNDSTEAYDYIGGTVGAGKTTYTDDIVGIYKYKVRAVYKITAGNYYGSCSSVVTASSASRKVTNVKVTARTANSVSLSWSAYSDVSGYVIWRYDKASGKYTAASIIKKPSTTTYTDSSLSYGTSYTYKVQAFDNSTGTVVYYTLSDAVAATTLPGKITGLKSSAYDTSSITMTWNAQTGVEGYYIFRYNLSTSSWIVVGKTTGCDKNTFKHTGLAAGGTYKYCVRAYYTSNGKLTYTPVSSAVNMCTAAKAVSGLKTSACNTNSITLSWTALSNVSGYVIYRYDSSTSSYVLCKRIDSKSTTTYTCTGLSAGTNYTFLVRGFKPGTNNYYFGVATTLVTCTRPNAVTGLTQTKLGSRYVLTWNKVANADGYYIFYYNKTTKELTYVNTVSGVKNTSYSAPVLSAKYAYYVAAYKTASGKSYRSTVSNAAVTSTAKLSATISGSSVNIRQGAGTGYQIVAKGSYGQSVTLLDSLIKNKQTWYKVSIVSGGTTYTGYVSGAYLNVK